MLQIPMSDRTLGRALQIQAERHAMKPFLLFEGRSYSYGDAATATANLAAGLRRTGIQKGDHVSVLMHNCPEMLWTIFALASIGAVTVPLNIAAKGQLLSYFLEQSKSSSIIVDSALLPNVAPAASHLSNLARFILHAEAGDAAVIPAQPTNHQRFSLGDLLEPSTASAAGDAPNFSDVQLIMYTSGTTGPSKGVMCTHSQEQTGGLFMAEQMGYCEDDVLYTCLPLFHANALRVTVNAALWAGATVALSRKFSASSFWTEIRASGATQFNALGAMANIILRQPPSDRDREHKVRLCNIVPALPQDTAIEFERRFGLVVTSMYGSTEVCCPLFSVAGTPKDKAPTCGRVVPPFEMRVVDNDDFEVPHGQLGEWVIRTQEPWYVFQGYYDMPAETVSAMRNFWFHSGDRGYRDEEGYFYFVDRTKDSLRRRGENISSYEVELSVSQHPSVLEVAVVPVASELGEDDVLAFVVLREGCACNERELIEFCEERMARFMVPRYLRFLSELPKTPSEKIEKYKLRQLAEREPLLLWDRMTNNGTRP